MSRTVLSDGLDKFKRYRIGKRAKGMKLLRLGVPDPTAPGFAEEARRQAALLGGVPEETEALDFIESVADTAKCTLTPVSRPLHCLQNVVGNKWS